MVILGFEDHAQRACPKGKRVSQSYRVESDRHETRCGHFINFDCILNRDRLLMFCRSSNNSSRMHEAAPPGAYVWHGPLLGFETPRPRIIILTLFRKPHIHY
jgi:hypothetical protein